MAEPPILPGEEDPQPTTNRSLPTTPSDSTLNPFAPSVISAEEVLEGGPRTELTAGYWISIAIVIVSSVGLLLVGFLPAWLAIAVTIPAAIRVPLIQRKLTRNNPELRLPHPVGMIVTSYALVGAFALASSVAFVVICVPSTIMFAISNDSLVNYTIGGSAAIALLMFLLLYWASLRLSI